MRKLLAMNMLADLHTHAAEDPRDDLRHSAEMLIDEAAAAGVDVLAITLHERKLVSERLRAYANARGVLLVPGIELTLEGKHVLVINPDEDQSSCKTFGELHAVGRRDAAIIAPHPFFPAPPCLGTAFFRHRDLFDAVEFSSMYCTGINFNYFAQWAAHRYQLPLIGSSDTHALPYCDTTLSVLEGECSVAGVVDAVRSGRITLRTRPRPVGEALRFGMKVAYDTACDIVGAR